MKKFAWVPGLVLFLFLGTQLAVCTPISVGISAFDSSATLIDFNAFSDGTLLTTQFAGLGLAVSGGLYADTVNSGTFFGSPAASNFVPANPGPGPYNTIILTFSTPIMLVGMDEISNVGFFNITDSNGPLAYSSSLAPSFAGFEDLAGFTSVTMTVSGAINNAFGIDNLRFEAATVPEPSFASMLAASVALFGLLTILPRSLRLKNTRSSLGT